MPSLLFAFFFIAHLICSPNSYAQNNTLIVSQVFDINLLFSSDFHFENKQKFLIVRPPSDTNDDPLIIANGFVLKKRGSLYTLAFEPSLVKKRPQPGDQLVVIGNPKVFKPNNKQKSNLSDIETITPDKKSEPGYIYLGFPQKTLSLNSVSPNQANSLKKTNNINLSGFEIEWFLDFVSNYGFYFSNLSGAVPIYNYYGQTVPASLNSQYFELLYRTKINKNVRVTLGMGSLNQNFITSNTDEYVLSSKYSTNGVVAKFAYEMHPRLLRAKHFEFEPTGLNISAYYGLSHVIKDTLLSRGESVSGASSLDLKASFISTFWLPWVPYVKRWNLTLGAFQKNINYSFSGQTISENVLGAYQIPPNQTYSENETGYEITIGFTFDDAIGKLFKPED